MTDERTRPTIDPDDPDRPATDPDDRSQESGTKPEEPDPWLREGADAPDAADIEDPDTQL